EDEELRRQKLEEALEVKSLRRIISAYLNYPEASEQDIKRYERSFSKIPSSHKALLSHLPLKYKNIRWCVAQNSYFIFEMLKAFEPPVDMTADVHFSEEKEHVFPGNPNSLPSLEGDIFQVKLDEVTFNEPVERQNGFPQAEWVGDQSDENAARDFSSPSEYAQKVMCDATGFQLSDTFSFLSSLSPDWLDPSIQLQVPLVDVDKVRCIIRNIVRDWAAEGQRERDECYKPILRELERLYPERSRESPPSCLVPGAGLGRLALEISSLGFISQGNEFSYYMMICSSFILNNSSEANEWTIYPWIHSNCNSFSDNDQLRPVPIPDIHPASAGITEGFSMCGGDFVEVYNDPSQMGAWDAVVTCFFIDTAHNIVEYIETISRVVKDGGVWVNLGPLLYHFAEASNHEDEISVEVSLEEVKRVACRYGFEIEKESIVTTTYSSNQRSMMQIQYKTAFWSMRK
ncbi:hypothetical protein M569_04321, partial [Genlisea aurea]